MLFVSIKTSQLRATRHSRQCLLPRYYLRVRGVAAALRAGLIVAVIVLRTATRVGTVIVIIVAALVLI